MDTTTTAAHILTAGTRYDVEHLTLLGWTDGDGSGHEGYHLFAYFRDGVYLGPDPHGIEPLVDVEGVR